MQNWIHSNKEEGLAHQENEESEEGEAKLPPVLNKSQIEARIHEGTFSQAMHEAESIKFTIWDYGGQAVSSSSDQQGTSKSISCVHVTCIVCPASDICD